jgi:hypothetical protein
VRRKLSHPGVGSRGACAARASRAALERRFPSATRGPGWRLVAAALALGLPACFAPPERGYYAPAGANFGDAYATQRQASPDLVLDVGCQGAYVDRVNGQQVLTVHVQLEATRPRSGDLVLARDSIVVDVELAHGGPRLRLPLSDAWTRRALLSDDLVVPAWTLRPFDLFFDSPLLVDQQPPESVLLHWSGRAGETPIAGECLFERIAAGDRRLPGDEPMQDPAFGMRNGYYLPGAVRFGTRGLRDTGEERLHYMFHAPGGWMW